MMVNFPFDDSHRQLCPLNLEPQSPFSLILNMFLSICVSAIPSLYFFISFSPSFLFSCLYSFFLNFKLYSNFFFFCIFFFLFFFFSIFLSTFINYIYFSHLNFFYFQISIHFFISSHPSFYISLFLSLSPSFSLHFFLSLILFSSYLCLYCNQYTSKDISILGAEKKDEIQRDTKTEKYEGETE